MENSTGMTGTDGAIRRLEAAERLLRTEQRQVRTELDAFQSLEARIRRIQPVGREGPQATSGPQTVPSPSSSMGKLEAVRTAYEETVMDVSHYVDTYGDTYERSVATEFGADVESALTEGSRFTQRSKRALISAVQRSQREREQFLALLEPERESLATARDVLEPVKSQVREFEAVDLSDEPPSVRDGYWTRLDVLDEKCDDLVARRQERLADHRRAVRGGSEEIELTTYLYGDLPTSHPVLSVAVELAGRIEDLQRELRRAPGTPARE